MPKLKFQTKVEIPKYKWQTGYKKLNLFMGSCFTQNVGNKMATLKYPVDINPFGILYNPESVANGLEILLGKKLFTKNKLVEYQGLWHSFSHHGSFSSTNTNECLEKINSRITTSTDSLKSAGFLFLTFGTAWVYRYKKSGEIVANCHKIPNKEFSRERLSVAEIVERYTELLTRIWSENGSVKVVFTVSPIRHWKDGAIENQRSKATLLLAVEQLIQTFGEQKCAYFPSYEIVMDELRDYRFYAEDMLHISDVALKYIWQLFEEALINADSRSISSEILKISNAKNHRAFNKNSKEYYNFLTQVLNKIIELEVKQPYLNFQFEKEYFKTQLNEINKQI